ncbi:MAG: FHA domain-containing protein [Planctomycetota bacterium]
MLKLVLMTGPKAGRHVRVADAEPLTIGRDRGRLRLHDSRCSKRHAEITYTNGTWILRDAGSSNGTFLNKQPLSGLAELERGDIIQCGRIAMRVREANALGMPDSAAPAAELAHDSLDTPMSDGDFLASGSAVATPSMPDAEGTLDADDRPIESVDSRGPVDVNDELDLDALFEEADRAEGIEDDLDDDPIETPPVAIEAIDDLDDLVEMAPAKAPIETPAAEPVAGLVDPASQSDADTEQISDASEDDDASGDLLIESGIFDPVPGDAGWVADNAAQASELIETENEAEAEDVVEATGDAEAFDHAQAVEPPSLEVDAEPTPTLDAEDVADEGDVEDDVVQDEAPAATAEDTPAPGDTSDQVRIDDDLPDAGKMPGTTHVLPSETLAAAAGGDRSAAISNQSDAYTFEEEESIGLADDEPKTSVFDQAVAEPDTAAPPADDTIDTHEDLIRIGDDEPIVRDTPPLDTTAPAALYTDAETLPMPAESDNLPEAASDTGRADDSANDDAAQPADVSDARDQAAEPEPESTDTSEGAASESDTPEETDEGRADAADAAPATAFVTGLADAPATAPEHDAPQEAAPVEPVGSDDSTDTEPVPESPAEDVADPATDLADDAPDLDTLRAALAQLEDEPETDAAPEAGVNEDREEEDTEAVAGPGEDSIAPPPVADETLDRDASSPLPVAADADADLERIDDIEATAPAQLDPGETDYDAPTPASLGGGPGSASAVAQELDADAESEHAALVDAAPLPDDSDEDPGDDTTAPIAAQPPHGENPTSTLPPVEPRRSYRSAGPPTQQGLRRKHLGFAAAIIVVLGLGAALYLGVINPQLITGKANRPTEPAPIDPGSVGPISPGPDTAALPSNPQPPRDTGSNNPATTPPIDSQTPAPAADPAQLAAGLARTPNPFDSTPRVLGSNALAGRTTDDPSVTRPGAPPVDESLLNPGPRPVPPLILPQPGINPNPQNALDPGNTQTTPNAIGDNNTQAQDPADTNLDPTAPIDGDKLVFLVDCSGSLVDSLPQMLLWLHDAIATLQPGETFTIIFFKKDQAIEPTPPGLKPLTRDYLVDLDREWLNPNASPILPAGRSDPAAAFELALSYNPSDIYLLSDESFAQRAGDTTPEQAAAFVAETLGDADVRLHGVQFFYESGSSTLQTLAEQFDGSYEFVAETRHPDRDPIDLLEELENRNP